MTAPDDCQIPSSEAVRLGDSDLDPPEAGESVFVADQGPALDTAHVVNAGAPVVTACLQTTRCVGAVDEAGFLLDGPQLVERGFLTREMTLTVRAVVSIADAGGLLGVDGLSVQVVLHRGVAGHELPLGSLEGGFADGWENYTIDVPTAALAFPADPCLDLAPSGVCGVPCEPRGNDISFVFSGAGLPPTGSVRLSFTIDWLALEPKVGTEVASRPLMLVHGWIGDPGSWKGSAWVDTLLFEGVPSQIVELPKDGRVVSNGALITAMVRDMTRRLGVERISIVSHSKGGVDSREHVRGHDDVEFLLMIGTPNVGTPLASIVGLVPGMQGVRDLTPAAMQHYNNLNLPNPEVTYVAVSGEYDSPQAQFRARWMGPNDEVVPVSSVHGLGYASSFPYLTSVADIESHSVCAGLTNHSCLLFHQRIVDDLLPAFLTLATARQLGQRLPPAATVRGEAEGPMQLIMSANGAAPAGVPQVHPVLVDPQPALTFVVACDPRTLDVAVVDPAGRRIDAATPDPSVTLTIVDVGSPMSHITVDVLSSLPGTWVVEVTGLAPADPEAEPILYAVAAVIPVGGGTGPVLDVLAEPALLTAGSPVTLLASLSRDGLPVAGATVEAEVVHPDGTTTGLTLRDDGTGADATPDDGVYTAVLTDTAESGAYDVLVTATHPDFTRQQPVGLMALPAGTAFTGTVTDRGVDDDGDGLFEQLAVDVGLTVGTASTYRLTGTLALTASTEPIEQVRLEVALDPGPATVTLAFSGSPLSDLAVDGPYVLSGLVLEDADAAMVVALGAPHTTAPYSHTQFVRPVCVLTGTTADRGVNLPERPQEPFEELLVEVEVDLLAAAELDAAARLRASDGSLLDAQAISVAVPAGRSMLGFRFPAFRIFRGGLAGPYTVQELTVTGTAGGAPVSVHVPGTVAVTQAYELEDFAESPTFTVGGTVTGLAGSGLLLELVGVPFPIPVRVNRSGPFTFTFPRLFAGNPYEVRVRTQPGNPVQTCTVVNATGVIGDANVTDVLVQCS